MWSRPAVKMLQKTTALEGVAQEKREASERTRSVLALSTLAVPETSAEGVRAPVAVTQSLISGSESNAKTPANHKMVAENPANHHRLILSVKVISTCNAQTMIGYYPTFNLFHQ